MSLLRTLDRTSVVSSPGPLPVLSFLCPSIVARPSARFFSSTPTLLPPRVSSPAPENMDTLFIRALARAASCPEHAKQISTVRQVVPPVTTHHKTRRKSTNNYERRGL